MTHVCSLKRCGKSRQNDALPYGRRAQEVETHGEQNPNCRDTNIIVSQLETSGPRGSYWVAFIAFPNLRSFTRYGWLVLGKLDHFTPMVTGYRPHFFRKEISNVKFDYFRHNIVLFTRTSQSCLKSVALFDAVRAYGLTQRKPLSSRACQIDLVKRCRSAS